MIRASPFLHQTRSVVKEKWFLIVGFPFHEDVRFVIQPIRSLGVDVIILNIYPNLRNFDVVEVDELDCFLAMYVVQGAECGFISRLSLVAASVESELR